MRILLLDQYGEFGGAQHCLLEVAEGLTQRGWDAHVALPEGPLWNKLRPCSASVTALPCGPFHSAAKTPVDALRFLSQFQSQSRTIASLVRQHRIDLIYVNGPRVLPAAAWVHGDIPVVFHSHSVVTQSSAARLAREALRRSRATVVASSRFVAGWLGGHAPLHVIYNGIRALPFRPERVSYSRIGVLARIAPEKGQLMFVHAANIAARSNPELRFTICGGPVIANRTYFDQVCFEAGNLVEFRPWTDNIADFFASIDILAVPSEALDANPRVIPEAYASGVPVIAFDSGGIRELLDDGMTGALVRERSPEALAAAILDVVRCPARLRDFAHAGRKRWQRHYTLPRFQSEICGLLESRMNPNVRASAIA